MRKIEVCMRKKWTSKYVIDMRIIPAINNQATSVKISTVDSIQ